MDIGKHGLIIALASLASCSPAQKEDAAPNDVKQGSLATAPIKNAENENVGLASIIAERDQLKLKVSLSSMEPGTKALHLHTTGACLGSDFKSAGGHLNPADVSHGRLSKDGPHLGDFPNIEIAPDGLAEVSFPVASASNNSIRHILDDDGTAIMIHAGPDDYISDPAGAAGPRVACGVFKAN